MDLSFKQLDYDRIMPVFFLLVCFIAFWPVFPTLMYRWGTGDDSYCYLVAPVAGYVCWEMRDRFRFNDFSWSPWGLGVIVAALAGMVLGELASIDTFLFVSLWGLVAGLTVVLYGSRAWLLRFPLFVLLFIVPMPPFLERILTFNFRLLASMLSVWFLRLLGVSVYREGNLIDLGISNFEVVDACSGMRYLLPLLLMSFLIGHFLLTGWWRKCLLVSLTIPVGIVANSFRIVVAAFMWSTGRGEYAEGIYHDIEGFLLFAVSGVLILSSALLIRKLGTAREVDPPRDPGVAARKDPRLPLVLMSAACLAVLGGGLVFRELPSSAIRLERSSFASFPAQIGDWHGKRKYMDDYTAKFLGADDYLSMTFKRANDPVTIELFIPYYEYQGSMHTAHVPRTCLLGSGWAIVDTTEHSVRLKSGEMLPSRQFIARKDEHRILSAYFFLQRGRVVLNPLLNKFYTVWDAITLGRTDGALVRVEAVVPPGMDVGDTRPVLDAFIGEIWEILPHFVPN